MPHLAYRVNLDGTMNVLEAARLFDVGQVFFASTIAAFGPGLPDLVAERGLDAPHDDVRRHEGRRRAAAASTTSEVRPRLPRRSLPRDSSTRASPAAARATTRSSCTSRASARARYAAFCEPQRADPVHVHARRPARDHRARGGAAREADALHLQHRGDQRDGRGVRRRRARARARRRDHLRAGPGAAGHPRLAGRARSTTARRARTGAGSPSTTSTR